MSKSPSDSNFSDHFEKSRSAGYELPDEHTIGIIGVGILALVIGFGVFLGSWWLFHHFNNEVSKDQIPRSTYKSFGTWEEETPQPRLQLNPQVDLQEMLKKDQKTLSSFGWINDDWVHIPIDDAMNLVIEDYKKQGAQK